LAEEEEDGDSPQGSQTSDFGATPQSRLKEVWGPAAETSTPPRPLPSPAEANRATPPRGATRLAALKAKLEADRAKKAQR